MMRWRGQLYRPVLCLSAVLRACYWPVCRRRLFGSIMDGCQVQSGRLIGAARRVCHGSAIIRSRHHSVSITFQSHSTFIAATTALLSPRLRLLCVGDPRLFSPLDEREKVWAGRGNSRGMDLHFQRSLRMSWICGLPCILLPLCWSAVCWFSVFGSGVESSSHSVHRPHPRSD